jgi:hypothetical protein
VHHLGMKGQYLHLAHPIIDLNYVLVLEDQRNQGKDEGVNWAVDLGITCYLPRLA